MTKEEKESIIEEAIQLIDDLSSNGYTNYRIAKETMITDRTIGNYVNKATRPSFANAKILLETYKPIDNESAPLTITSSDLLSIRENLNISQDELARMIGVSRNTIGNYEKGGVIPESKRALLKSLTEQSNQDTKPRFESNVTAIPEGNYMWVEYQDLRASAGTIGGADVDQLAETHKRLVPKEFEKGNFLVIGVDGDSMNDGSIRSLSDGDEVLVCERKDFKIEELPIKKALFVITTREGNVIKQIKEVNMDEKYIVCHSFNPIYPDFKIEFRDIFQIFIVCKVTQKQITL